MTASVPLTSASLSAIVAGEAHSRAHGRTLKFGENVLAYAPNGVDDTAAFQAAETAGSSIVAPAGTYILNNWTPTTSRLVIQGAGQGATILKAKAGAAAAVTLSGLVHHHWSDLAFDGNATASKGLIITGSASAGSQAHTFDKCRFQNASVGTHVATGTTTQADKNSYLGCQWSDNTTGLWIDSVNAQQQLVKGGSFDSHTTAVRLSAGTFTFEGGNVQTATTSFLVDGPLLWLNLKDITTEATTDDIIGSGGSWPGDVRLENTTLQGSASTVTMNNNGAQTYARGCTFINGNIKATANDCLFVDEHTTLSNGAAWTPTGVNCRRHKWDLNGLTMYVGATEKFHAYNYNGEVMIGGKVVSEGAADSGGAGYKLLRVAN